MRLKTADRHFVFATIALVLAPLAVAKAQLNAPPLSATAVSTSQINLSWVDNNSSENGYSIERSLSSTSGFVAIAKVKKNSTAYQDKKLATTTTYYYRVRATGPKGAFSAYSNIASATTLGGDKTPEADTTPPSVPTGVTATATSCSQVSLSWTASTDDAGGSGLKGYNVYRNNVFLKQVLAPATSTSDTGLNASTSYSYTISALDNAGNESARSSAATVTTPACPDTTAPSVPTGLSASAASCSQINLSWNASTDTGGSGLKGYNVYRNNVFIKQVLAPATSTSDAGLNASTSYAYNVSAIDNAGNESAWSATSAATTPACPDTTAPSIPTGLTATAASSSQINLSWNASTDTGGSGLAGYKIYRGGVHIATTSATSYSNSGLSANTQYCYTVVAYDNAGNHSAQSAQACATTPAPPDTTPPSVSMTSPSAGAILKGTITLSANASDNVGVTKVEFYRGGVLLGTDTTAPYSLSFNTATVSDGSHTFSAKAYDAANNAGTSAGVTITIDNTPPSTSLTAPGHGSTVSNTIAITATASDNTGVTRVEFYRGDGIMLGTSTSAPHSIVFDTTTISDGVHTFYSKAYDAANNASFSSAISVTVNNSTSSPAEGDWVMGIGGAGTDAGYSVGTDNSGNVYVAGFFNGTVNFGGVTLTSAGGGTVGGDIFVAKYSPSGSLMWAQRFGGSGDDAALGLAVDKRNGDVAVTGYFSGTASFGANSYSSTAYKDAFIMKLSGGSGALQWFKQIGTRDWNVNPDDYGYGVAVDPNNGDVVATGQHSSSGLYDFGVGTTVITSGVNTYLIRYTSSGSLLWAKSMSGISQDSGRAVAVDAGGNVLLTGLTQGPIDLGGGLLPYVSNPQYNNGFVAKYSAAGAHLWSISYGSLYGLSEGLGIAVDGSGNVAVTGRFMGTIGFGNGVSISGSLGVPSAYLVKLSGSNGLGLWARAFVADQSTAARSVAVDSSGNISVTGDFFSQCNFGDGTLSSAGWMDGYLVKYSGSGAHLSSMRFGGANNDWSNGIAVDANANRYLTGTAAGGDFAGTTLPTAGSTDIFLMKLAP